MRHYLKFAGLFFGSLAFAPLLIGLVSALPGGPHLVLLVFGLLAVVLALAIGAVVFLIHDVRCAKRLSDPLHRVAVVLASPVLTVAVLLATLPLLAFGYYLGDQANRTRDRPRYISAPPVRVEPAPERIAN